MLNFDVIGQWVVHKKYGEGTIISVENEKWMIDFNGNKKVIIYTAVMGSTLKFKDAEVMERYLLYDKEKNALDLQIKCIAEEKTKIHNKLYDCEDLFGYLMELCRSNRDQFKNVYFIKELKKCITCNKKMDVQEEKDFDNALKLLAETPYEEYPIYPVLLITTHSKEGDRFYIKKIMDKNKKHINLSYENESLREAVNVIAYWCTMTGQRSICHATEITDYTANAIENIYFKKEVARELENLFERSSGYRYFNKLQKPLQIGSEFYMNYFYQIKSGYHYAKMIHWGGRSEFNNGTDVSISYILPTVANVFSKYHQNKAKEHLHKIWESEYQNRKSLKEKGILHKHLGYGKIYNATPAFIEVLFFEDKTKRIYNYEQITNNECMLILDDEENAKYLQVIHNAYREELSGRKIYTLRKDGRYLYYGDIEKFEFGLIYVKSDSDMYKRRFRYPEDEISKEIIIV